MTDPLPKLQRSIVESANFDIDFSAERDCPALPSSNRSSGVRSEGSTSEYKSVTSDDNDDAWYYSTLNVTSMQEDLQDIGLQEGYQNAENQCTDPGPDINRNSISKSQDRNANDEDQDAITVISSENFEGGMDDEPGNRHRRVTFMDTIPNGSAAAKQSEINIFGKNQGNSFFHLKFTTKTFLKALASIVLYFLDVYSDISMAIEFGNKGMTLYCVLTASIVALQMVITAIADIAKFRSLDKKILKYKIADKMPRWVWVMRLFGLAFGIIPAYRIILFCIYSYRGKKSRTQEERTRFALLVFAEKMSTLTLFIKESYFESAPQLILQLYIIFRQNQRHEVQFSGDVHQLITVSLSLLSFAWTLREYDSSCAAIFFDIDFTKLGNLLVFFWRLLTTFSQCVVIALCFALFPLPFFLVCLMDYVIMILYSCIILDTPKTIGTIGHNRRWTNCYTKLKQCKFVFFSNVYSAIPLVISFVFMDDFRTRDIQIVLYYAYKLVYNSVLIGIWAGLSQEVPAYRYGFFGAVILALIAGVLVLGLYYVLYQKPAKPITQFKCVINGEDIKRERLSDSIAFLKEVSLRSMTFSYRHS